MAGAGVIVAGFLAVLLLGVGIWLLVAKFATHTWPFDKDRINFIIEKCPAIESSANNASDSNVADAYTILKDQKTIDCSAISNLFGYVQPITLSDKKAYISNSCSSLDVSNASTSNITAAYTLLKGQATTNCLAVTSLIKTLPGKTTTSSGYSIYGANMAGGGMISGGLDNDLKYSEF